MRGAVATLISLAIAGCGAKTGLGTVERERGADAAAMASDAGPIAPPRGRTLSMSWSHACAIDSGEVVCWGDNSLGTVGEGVMTPAPPTRVPGLVGVREVATGQLVSCALDGDGAVWCWGTVVGSSRPRRIDALPRAERIVAGSSTVCVITAERTVACTGIAVFFSAGRCAGPTDMPDFEDVATVALDDVVDLALGQRHACAVRADGSVWCWGCGGSGELGRIGVLGSEIPLVVPGVSARRIAAETGATCATSARGEVTCWGDGSQFGVSLTVRTVEPRAVTFEAEPADLDVGVISTCAGGGDAVGCQGFLIFGDCTDRRVDSRRATIRDVREVSIGYEDMCARDARGTVRCWGCNSTGAAGDGTREPRPEPLAVSF